ncbi:MAG: hypothetical protein ABFD91_01355 [Anaerohalosphaeraceae bacterium]
MENKLPKSVKEFFVQDFTTTLNVHQPQILTSQENKSSIEIIAQLHLDFTANAKYISCYIPETKEAFDVCKSILINPNWALSISGTCKIEQKFCSDPISLSNLIFTGKIFIYSENELSDDQKKVLLGIAKQQHLFLECRGPKYIKRRHEAYKSTSTEVHVSPKLKELKETKSLKPSSNNQTWINAIGKSLTKTLPQNWKEARLKFEKNITSRDKWVALYTISQENNRLEEKTFILTEDIIANLNKLKAAEESRNPISDIIFHSDHKYEIRHEYSKVKRAGIDEVEREIEILRKLDLKDIDIDSLKEHTNALIVGYSLTTPIISSGKKFYRGVPWPEKPINVAQLSYPPREKVDEFHRAGRPNHSLFYCSCAREAVFYELGVNAGDKVVISQWETMDFLLVNNIGYCSDTLKKLGTNRECPSWSNENDPEKTNMLIRQFFSDEFTKIVPRGQGYLYKTSVAIAEQHFQSDMFDALLYPSVAMKGYADNLAIKPPVVDKKLVLKRAEYIDIKDYHDDRYSITMLDFADSFTKDGKIEWKGRLPQWVLHKDDQVTVAVENGKWVARNTSGEIVEPE